MEDVKVIEQAHLTWFRDDLIENGASRNITERQVRASAGYEASSKAFEAGWKTLAIRCKAKAV